MTTQELYALPINQYGWRVLPTGNYVKLGDGVKLGNYVTLGDDGLIYNWSPQQIQGSKHLLYVAGPNIIGVGCIRHDAAWWLENYKTVGRSEGYSAQQIEEYRLWLDVAIAWQTRMREQQQ